MASSSQAAAWMKIIDLHYAGRSVALPDLPAYAKFYRKLAAGTWEPATFEVLDRNLDRDTVFLDIGAWIGVTPFWASRSAKAVIAVEPDPRCLECLNALAPTHGNVTVRAGALSDKPMVTIHAVGGFGGSETSILDLGGDELKVAGVTMRELLASTGESPLFVKIDIEGYEFAAMGEIARLRDRRVKGVQIAVHPQLLEKGLGHPWRRLRTAWSVWKLGRLFRGFFPGPSVTKYGGLLTYIVTGVLLRRLPRGADFVFERQGRVKS